MKKLTPLVIVGAAFLFTSSFPVGVAAQSQGARAERAAAAPKNLKAQRRTIYRTADTSCHTYGGYGWGPYFGPCPYRGEVYAVGPTTPVLPILPFGPFW